MIPVQSKAHSEVSREPRSWIALLAETETDSGRLALLDSHNTEFSEDLVDAFYDQVVTLARIDLGRAERFAQAAGHVARMLPHGRATGVAYRAQGHVYFLTGDHVTAIEHHRMAVAIFEPIGDPLQAARALMNQIQPLTYLGRSAEAFEAAQRRRNLLVHENLLSGAEDSRIPLFGSAPDHAQHSLHPPPPVLLGALRSHWQRGSPPFPTGGPATVCP